VGHIEVTFHATGGTRRQRPPCGKNQPYPFAAGYYEGTIDFHGEEGYAEVEALRAKGDATLALGLVCSANHSSGIGPGLPGAELRVRPKRGNSTPTLTAVENNPRAPVQLEVNTDERNGEVQIERTIRVTASRTSLNYDAKLRTATLYPPAPFSGSGRFTRRGHGGRWSGDLAVDLPGRSGVPLTGGTLRANLFRARFKGAGPLG
jgi:hypothetical protein